MEDIQCLVAAEGRGCTQKLLGIIWRLLLQSNESRLSRSSSYQACFETPPVYRMDFPQGLRESCPPYSHRRTHDGRPLLDQWRSDEPLESGNTPDTFFISDASDAYFKTDTRPLLFFSTKQVRPARSLSDIAFVTRRRR